MPGWISLHRKIKDNPVWADPYFFKLWTLCLLKASHKSHEQTVGNQVITLEPGQFITGRDALADEFNKGAKKQHRLSAKTIERKLVTLEKLEMLTIKKTTKYSLVTVVNWNEYQQNDQQVTTNRPSSDQQVTTNNNGNNGDNGGGGDTLADAYDFYENNFGLLNPFISEDIGIWCDDLSPDLVIAAMKIALRQGKQWSYARGPLKRWYNAGLSTLDDVRTFEKQRQRDMNKNKGFSYRQGKEEKRKKMREKILEESE